MLTSSLKLLSAAVNNDGSIHYTKGKLMYQDGPDLNWIPCSNRDEYAALTELCKLGYLTKIGKIGTHNTVFTITTAGRDYWLESQSKYN